MTYGFPALRDQHRHVSETARWRNRPPLLLDSNTQMRRIVMSMMREAGAKDVITVADGRNALQALEKHSPSVMLLDWSDQSDPTEDRLALIRQIRESEILDLRAMPLVILTAPRPQSEVEAARDAGVTEFLVTPISQNTLIQRLESLGSAPRSFVDSPRFRGPDRRRKSRDPVMHGFKRQQDVNAGLTSPLAAARSGAMALSAEISRRGDPLARRVTRSLQAFSTWLREVSPADAEVIEMHRASLAQLAEMQEDGHPLRQAVVFGLEQVVRQRIQAGRDSSETS